MGRKWLIIVGVVLMVGALVVTVAVPALAQDATPTPGKPDTPRSWFFWGRGFPFGMRGGDSWQSFDAVAEALGMTPEQLFSELHSGKTLEEIAEAKGVDMEAVKDALTASQKEALKAEIEQAVEDGKLTREQADWLLEGLDLGMLPGGRFMGRSFWFRGRGCLPGKAPRAPSGTSGRSF